MTAETEEKLLQDVGFIRAQTASQTLTLDEHGRKLDSIDHILSGNGKPGLKATVARHEATFSTIKRALWIVLTPVLAAIGGGVIAFIIHSLN